MQTFSPQKFVEGLGATHGIPELPMSLCIRGMAKKSEAEISGIQSFDFSPSSNCKFWVPIPTALVEKIDHLGKVPCKDHEHDFVCVHFVNAKTDEGKVLAQLLQQLIGLGETWNAAQPRLFTPSGIPATALTAMPAANAFLPPHVSTASWPPHPPNWPWPPGATVKSRITVTNRDPNAVWVKISKACGGGDDSFFEIEPGGEETWRRCVYHRVTIQLSSGGSLNHITAVSTGCNHYAIEGGDFVYLGPPNCL